MKRSITILVSIIWLVAFSQSDLYVKQLDENVVIEKDTIFGTLSLPGCETKVPLVIFVAGSGPTDRNGNSLMMSVTNSYLLLANELNSKNIATYRYDKRGIAMSAKSLHDVENTTLETYINDANSIVERFKKDKRFSKIILLGHSEGALISTVVAKNNSSLKGLISVAGTGESIDKTLKKQLEQLPETLRMESYTIIDSLKNKQLVHKVNPQLKQIFNPTFQKFLISWMQYEPTEILQKVTIPICIIQGTKDIQVSTENAIALQKANPKAKLHILQNMNHVLKTIETDDRADNLKLYNSPTIPIHAELSAIISDFVKK